MRWCSGTLPRVDFLKIDAEGAELSVLRGGLETLKRFHPAIQFELLGAALEKQGSCGAQICDLLEQCGYRFLIFGKSGRPQRAPVVDVDGDNVLAVHPENRAMVEKIEACIDS